MPNFSERPGRHRRRPRRGATVAAVVVAVLGAATAVWAVTPGEAPAARPAPRSGGRSAGATRPKPAVSRVKPPGEPAPPVRITYPAAGERTWRTAAGSPVTAGERGTLRRYRVLVEQDIKGLKVNEFADAVSRALNDPRGWTAGDRLRLRRAGPGQPYDFTIYLATPETRDFLCGSGRDGYTSCRNGDAVVVNVARWVKGVPDYGADLAVYRQYLVNHEVGHLLGHGHELCPGKGRPAPVMQQQTLGMHGCEANPWPYLDGERYAGTSGAYQDPAPPPDRGSSDPAGEPLVG